MKIAIIGHTNAGKTTLRQLLEKQGLNCLTYLTDSTHPADDERAIDMDRDTDKKYGLMSIHIDGTKRFALDEDILNCDVLITDKEHLEELSDIIQNESIHIVLCEKDESLITPLSETEFKEWEDYEQFAKDFTKNKITGCNMMYRFINNKDNECIENYARYLTIQRRKHANLTTIVEQSVAFGNLDSRIIDTVRVWYKEKDQNGNQKFDDIPYEYFADSVLGDDKGMIRLIHSWLGNEIIIGVPETMLAETEDNDADTDELPP